MVKPNGSKLWQFRFRYMEKEKLLSLGQYPIVSLADARKKRDDAKRLLEDGTDPSVQKKLDRISAQVKARMTFKEVADEYYQGLVERGLAPATLRKKRWQIDDLAKPLHNRPIDQITAAELLHLLKPIEQSGRRETTKKLRTTISAIFRLAMVASGVTTFLSSHPVAWRYPTSVPPAAFSADHSRFPVFATARHLMAPLSVILKNNLPCSACPHILICICKTCPEKSHNACTGPPSSRQLPALSALL